MMQIYRQEQIGNRYYDVMYRTHELGEKKQVGGRL